MSEDSVPLLTYMIRLIQGLDTVRMAVELERSGASEAVYHEDRSAIFSMFSPCLAMAFDDEAHSSCNLVGRRSIDNIDQMRWSVNHKFHLSN